ncbi:MAG: hypothetical protein WCC11_07530 [Gammaproteobacteria bacterium]
MKTRNFIRNPSHILLVAMLGIGSGMAALADNPPTNTVTAAAVNNLSTANSAKTQTANLGKINVTAMRELVKTLQVVKVALNEPFSTSRDKADVVVCRIIEGHGYLNVQERMGAVLECGTNSWFTWQSDKCRIGGLAACTPNGTLTAAYKRKGAWHSMRALNLRQVMALRQLLKELPAPGKGNVVVVDKNGKAVMALKASDGSGGDDKN